MPQYTGFSTINACKPIDRNIQLNTMMNSNGSNGTGIPTGNGNTDQGITTGKKFTLTDVALVIQDFINALNIPLGSKVGQPQYGTTLWNYLFDPNTLDIQTALQNEIRRVASLDPRIILNSVIAFPQENGILLEVEIAIALFNTPLTVSIFLNQQTKQALLNSAR